MSTKISDDSMSLEIDGLTPREAALYGPQATKVAARSVASQRGSSQYRPTARQPG